MKTNCYILTEPDERLEVNGKAVIYWPILKFEGDIPSDAKRQIQALWHNYKRMRLAPIPEHVVARGEVPDSSFKASALKAKIQDVLAGDGQRRRHKSQTQIWQADTEKAIRTYQRSRDMSHTV